MANFVADLKDFLASSLVALIDGKYTRKHDEMSSFLADTTEGSRRVSFSNVESRTLTIQWKGQERSVL